MSDWTEQLRNRLCNISSVSGYFTLTNEEKAFFSDDVLVSGLPVGITRYYASLASDSPDDPVRRQCVPSIREANVLDYEEQDPLSEKRYSPVPRLIHRYEDRVLVLTTDHCAVYCRHCFRRHFAGSRAGPVSDAELNRIAEYLEDHPLVEEIILSGGDPLTLPDDRIGTILTTLGRKRRRVFRIATRVPVVLPGRITAGLAALLSRFAPVWLVTQFNHPVELADRSREALRELSSHGIPVFNQTVLLQGINDDPEILKTLFHSLVRSGVKPYYLFQGDLAQGTSHFRVPLERTLKIMWETEKGLSGMAIPAFALDLPGGGGKIRLSRDSICEKTDEWYTLKDQEGNRFRYPREE